MRILRAAHKCVDSHFTLLLLSLYAIMSPLLFLMCLRHLGIFCMVYALANYSSISFLIFLGILYRLWLIARLRIDLGRAWWPFFLVSISSSVRNLEISIDLSSTNLLKLRCRWFSCMCQSTNAILYYFLHIHHTIPIQLFIQNTLNHLII